MPRVSKPFVASEVQTVINELEANTKFAKQGDLWKATAANTGHSPAVIYQAARLGLLTYVTEKGKVGRQGVPKPEKAPKVDLSAIFDAWAGAGFPITDASCILTGAHRSDEDNNKIRKATAALRTALNVPSPHAVKPKVVTAATTETVAVPATTETA